MAETEQQGQPNDEEDASFIAAVDKIVDRTFERMMSWYDDREKELVPDEKGGGEPPRVPWYERRIGGKGSTGAGQAK
jgi:hypothetical protein